MVPLAIMLALQRLDAPVIPKQPTVRSEIRRGVDAAWDCVNLNMLTEMLKYEGCIEAAHSANRQRMGSSFEAFDVGLYRTARDQVALFVQDVSKNPELHISPTVVRGVLNIEEDGYQTSRKALRLTDAQVESVLAEQR